MAGVILETLSNRKLICFGVVLFLMQVGFFLIGGLIAPAPHNVQHLLSNICVDDTPAVEKFLYPRGVGKCHRVDNLDDEYIRDHHVTANQIVFSIQFPVPKEGYELIMSRVQQSMIAVAEVRIEHQDGDDEQGIESTLTMDARLGYRVRDYTSSNNDNWTDWKEIARSTEDRPLRCDLHKPEKTLSCDLMPLFELGSVHYDSYLLNIRLPIDRQENSSINANIGKVKEIFVYVIHPNGGFTYVWFSIKTFVFPFIAIELAWYIGRIYHLDRTPTVLEQTLIAVGAALTLLNLPIDWLTLWLYMPFMVLYSDIRQGLFYSVLLSFWIIFAGEHTMDQKERNNVLFYWKHLSAVGFGCICLFVFEMCERGVQLTNPFYSIWATTTGRNLGLAFIILAGISAVVYFVFLLAMIVRVFRNIYAKKSALPSMSKPRRKFYMGLIYRFSFLMVFTLLCAAMTVVLFIVGQTSEGRWKWMDHNGPQYTSAVQTGVYGMWNIYVFCLLILYAPSNKYIAVAEADESNTEEHVEFSTIPSEASVLTSFVQKATVD